MHGRFVLKQKLGESKLVSTRVIKILLLPGRVCYRQNGGQSHLLSYILTCLHSGSQSCRKRKQVNTLAVKCCLCHRPPPFISFTLEWQADEDANTNNKHKMKFVLNIVKIFLVIFSSNCRSTLSCFKVLCSINPWQNQNFEDRYFYWSALLNLNLQAKVI